MKRFLIYTIILSAAMWMVACNKFLDVTPKDAVSDELTIVDKTSAQTALRGTYRKLAADGYYGSLFQTFGYLPGDNVQWTGSQSIIQQFITHQISADNGNLASVWSAIYATINSANHVITKVPTVTDATFATADRNQLIGEALFIRALCFFDLARTWGNVQITLTPTLAVTDKTNIAQSTQSAVYDQVLTDLNAAEQLLQLPGVANPVRVNLETVWALKSRYYLYRGQWDNAAAYAAKVLADKNFYQLLKPFSSFFSPASAIATKESVFELSYSATYSNGHRNYWQPPANGGTRQWAPNDAFVALVNNAAIGGNRNVLVAKTSAGLWYGNLYYRSPATDPAYIIRIAEIYLVYAEALANQNKLLEAVVPLNAVRDRAGLPPTTATTQADILLAIENERRIEFALEPHRWFDLVRTNRAAAVLGVTDPKQYLFPIPAQEIVLSNGKLTQNPQ
ncbi:RagB/SusD family nutrient uptake outer membrane protein [Chitinophaga sp. Cy-1792]|uniref:RagB/SusD family nutrient uptake outer membrane protein n=1 Tax=Chitinophaga sp. Cy-1792 TaxID=2608339 RepID=UPI001423F500|nr:RagB/SusD family nutrient uptake outer membrane protein [Chitinophaga sp. Cy-1792]NIG55952.1 RagB/SusD family nutrient uptake outer membrane protein [Chitinophaga sp. Cy-1792]